MSPQDAILHLGAIPGGAAAGVALLLALLGARRGSVLLRDAGAAFGVAAGLAAGLWFLDVRPSLPLGPEEDTWEWVFWLGLLGAVLGTLDAAGRAKNPWRPRVARFLAGGLAVGLVLGRLAPHALSETEVLLRAGIGGLATAGLWTLGAREAARRPEVTFLPALLVASGGASYLLLEAGRSASMATAAAVLAAALGAVALVGLLRRTPTLPAAAVPAAVLPFVGLLAAAHGTLNYGTSVRFPTGTALALALAPLAVLALPRRLADRRPWILPALAAAALAGLGVGLAAWLAPLGEQPVGPW